MPLLSALMSLGIPARIAVVVGLLCLFGAALATFLPASSSGAECGTWPAPEWSEERTRELVRRAGELGQLGAPDGLLIAARASTAARECDETLDGRRTVSLSLAGLAVAGPAAVLWITRPTRSRAPGRPPEPDQTEDRPIPGPFI